MLNITLFVRQLWTSVADVDFSSFDNASLHKVRPSCFSLLSQLSLRIGGLEDLCMKETRLEVQAWKNPYSQLNERVIQVLLFHINLSRQSSQSNALKLLDSCEQSTSIIICWYID